MFFDMYILFCTYRVFDRMFILRDDDALALTHFGGPLAKIPFAFLTVFPNLLEGDQICDLC